MRSHDEALDVSASEHVDSTHKIHLDGNTELQYVQLCRPTGGMAIRVTRGRATRGRGKGSATGGAVSRGELFIRYA